MYEGEADEVRYLDDIGSMAMGAALLMLFVMAIPGILVGMAIGWVIWG